MENYQYTSANHIAVVESGEIIGKEYRTSLFKIPVEEHSNTPTAEWLAARDAYISGEVASYEPLNRDIAISNSIHRSKELARLSQELSLMQLGIQTNYTDQQALAKYLQALYDWDCRHDSPRPVLQES